MRRPVVVDGAGLAGLTCARLLAAQGRAVLVNVHGGGRAAPTLVLNQVTLALLSDIWGPDHALLAGAHPLSDRWVRWGDDPPHRVPQPSLVVPADRLIQSLLATLRRECGSRVELCHDAGPGGAEPSSWSVTAHSPSLPDRTSLGQRTVLAAKVPVVPHADHGTCLMESGPDGWIYLIPLGMGQALIQAMVPRRPVGAAVTLSRMLAGTTDLHRLVVGASTAVTVFDASPWLREIVCGSRWLAIGAAAMRLDPLSGSGATYAIREAILASAVIQAADDGLPVDECLEHYRHRMSDAFLAHLHSCLNLYRTGVSSPEWDREIEPMRRALRVSAAPTKYRYRLHGTRLVPGPAA